MSTDDLRMPPIDEIVDARRQIMCCECGFAPYPCSACNRAIAVLRAVTASRESASEAPRGACLPLTSPDTPQERPALSGGAPLDGALK